MTVNTEQALVHLMFSGRQHDIPVSDLDVGDLSTPTEVRRAVAEHLSVPVTKLDNFTVERNENGDILMRPQAIFGIIKICVCHHDYQDAKYGNKKRVCNITKDGQYRCTVCGKIVIK